MAAQVTTQRLSSRFSGVFEDVASGTVWLVVRRADCSERCSNEMLWKDHINSRYYSVYSSRA